MNRKFLEDKLYYYKGIVDLSKYNDITVYVDFGFSVKQVITIVKDMSFKLYGVDNKSLGEEVINQLKKISGEYVYIKSHQYKTYTTEPYNKIYNNYLFEIFAQGNIFDENLSEDYINVNEWLVDNNYAKRQ